MATELEQLFPGERIRDNRRNEGNADGINQILFMRAF
jgi:hypothetical protein